jgi:tetratricopeptide (TPR) repeat protein
MSDDNPKKSNVAGWTPTQGYVLAVLCFLIGMAGGYLTRGSSGQMATAPAPNAQPFANAPAGPSQSPPQELQQALAQQVPPLLERLKSDPNNAELLADIGNMYFDAHQYSQAAPYYSRVLKIQPLNTAVRTDLGTSYWLLGDADRAIAEFQTSLKTAPNQANTLLNLGVVQWKGKMDAEAALATWQKLLDTNPAFAGRDRVVQMMAQARQHLGIQPGTKTDKPAAQ